MIVYRVYAIREDSLGNVLYKYEESILYLHEGEYDKWYPSVYQTFNELETHERKKPVCEYYE